MSALTVYLVSDSTGELAEQYFLATSSQFSNFTYDMKKFVHILTQEMLEDVFFQINHPSFDTSNSVVFYMIRDHHLNEKMKAFTQKENIPAVDILQAGIANLENKLQVPPTGEPIAEKKLSTSYFRRIEAIEFGVKHDDGKDPRGIHKADIVILGISRTSKTPVSLYLANRNIKVANIPLILEAVPPKELFEVPSHKVVGLTTSPDSLSRIRKKRLIAMDLDPNVSYGKTSRIIEELEYADDIMNRIGCLRIDVSDRAIEETAEIIMEYMKKQGMLTV